MSDKLEILNTRVFAASRQRVFDAFAKPQQLKHWWGTAWFHQQDPRIRPAARRQMAVSS